MSIATTGHALIRQAFGTLNVYAPTDQIPVEDLNTALDLLRELVDSWTLKPGTVLVVDRHVFALDSTHGSPTLPYTLGPGGIWDTGTAERPPDIDAANLVLNTAAPYPVEVPLSFQTDDAYAAGQVKTLTSPQPTTFYYNATSPLGTIVLWPVPTNTSNEIALYYDRLTVQFAGLEDAYICPPGYAKAFRLCLANALVPYFGVPADRAAWVDRASSEALDEVLASNFKPADVALDPAFTPSPHGTYNIYTDTGG